MSFVLFASAKSWIESVMGETQNHYDRKADPRATADDVSTREAERLELATSEGAPTEDELNEVLPALTVGDYLTDGTAAFRFETSIGNGKGSTVLPLGAADLPSIVGALSAPLVDLDKLSPAECIRRTIARTPATDTEPAVISFKVSLAKHSRTVIVPEDQWPAFLAYVTTLNDRRLDAIAHYRASSDKAEAEAAAKAAKAAANKPAGS